MACTLAGAMMLACSSSALAAYEQSTGTAGTTAITAEVGYNGASGYAKVSGSANIDASMSGTANYESASGLGSKNYIGSFSQQVYGETTCTCPGSIYLIDCTFQVSSDDGSWSKYSYAG